MSLYIQYNPTTGQIINWFDTDYAATPAGASVIPVTYAELNQVQTQQGWTVQGGVLTAPTPATLLALAQTQQINTLYQACDAAIQAGFPSPVGTITLRQGGSYHDQTNAIMAALVSQGAISQAKKWTPLTTFPAASLITDGSGQFWITFAEGVSGTAMPQLPTAFSVGVLDGTIEWFKFGFRISTSNGTQLLDPNTIMSLFIQGVIFVNNLRGQYTKLKSQVEAATTLAEVQAVTWTNRSIYSNQF